MARRINRLQLFGVPNPAPEPPVQPARMAKVKPGKAMNRMTESDIDRFTMRELARERGIPQGFYFIPKEIQEKLDAKALDQKKLEDAVRSMQKPGWKSKYIPLIKEEIK